MILVDANLLFYAEDALSPKHDAARMWWDETLSSPQPVGLAWITCLAYIRIFTNPRAVTTPISLADATGTVDGWLSQPNVRLLNPTTRFWAIFRKLLLDSQAGANLSSDAFLAALALNHDCELQTTDMDFARFATLRWRNPIAS